MLCSLRLLLLVVSSAPSLSHASPGLFELFSKSDEASKPVLLPLTQRQQTFTSGAKRNFYVGTVRAGHGAGNGQPQELQVFFDTGSGHVLLDSDRCKSIPCIQHHQYSPEASSHSVGAHVFDMDAKGNSVGKHKSTGEMFFDMADDSTTKKARATADLVHDTMCLGMERKAGSSTGEACADVGFMAATSLSNELFLNAPFDGLVGLSLEGMSASKECNWFSRLVAAGAHPKFALFLPPTSAGSEQMAEIAFGGYNPARLATDISWLPVVEPEKGYWQLRVTSVRVGERTFDISDGLGIVDTSSPSFGIPEEVFGDAKLRDSDLAAVQGAQCSGGPDIVLTFADSTELKLSSSEYMEQADGKCVSQLHSMTAVDRSETGSRTWNGKIVTPAGLSSLTFILGEPILRKYYTIFDTESKKIGFGLSASAAGAPAPRQPQQTDEIILMQTTIKTSRK